MLFDNVEYTGIELEKDYYDIARSRIKWAQNHRQELEKNIDWDKNKINFNKVVKK